MSQIVKAFSGIFFLLLLLFLGIGIVSAQMDVEKAKDYKSDIVMEIENSNYSVSVLNACIEQAKANGYDIAITVYQENGVANTYAEANVMNTEGAYLAEILLTYHYGIGILNTSTEHSIRGFSR